MEWYSGCGGNEGGFRNGVVDGYTIVDIDVWVEKGCGACREICVEGVKADVEGVNIRSVNVDMKKIVHVELEGCDIYLSFSHSTDMCLQLFINFHI